MHIYALFSIIFILMMNLTLPLVGGNNIVSSLGGNADIIIYGVSFYSVGTALGIVLGKPKLMPMRPINWAITCLLGMVISNLGCALATNYATFIVCRFLDGIAAGPLFPLINNYLMPKMPAEDRKHNIELYVLCYTGGPLIGSAVGGVIGFEYNWRWLFYAVSTLCIGLTIYFFTYFRPRYNQKLDVIKRPLGGYFLFFITIICLATALITAQEFDWYRSAWLVRLFTIGFLSLCAFALHTAFAKQTFFNRQLFQNPYFSLSMLFVAVVFSVYFGCITLVAAWLFFDVQYTPNWISLLIFIMIIGLLVRIFFTIHQYEPRYPAFFGILFCAICCFYSTTFDWDIDFNRILISRLSLGFTLPLFLPPLLRFIRHGQEGDFFCEADTIFHTVRTLASGLGVGLFHILWQRRQVFYHQRLGGDLTAFSTLTDQFMQKARIFRLTAHQAQAQLNHFLDRQASALALDDCFWLMGWMLVGLLVILAASFFLKPNIQRVLSLAD